MSNPPPPLLCFNPARMTGRTMFRVTHRSSTPSLRSWVTRYVPPRGFVVDAARCLICCLLVALVLKRPFPAHPPLCPCGCLCRCRLMWWIWTFAATPWQPSRSTCGVGRSFAPSTSPTTASPSVRVLWIPPNPQSESIDGAGCGGGGVPAEWLACGALDAPLPRCLPVSRHVSRHHCLYRCLHRCLLPCPHPCL